MPEYNSKDIDYLLDVSSVLGRDFQARMKHFEEKAELLGFSKVIFSKVHSRSKNKFIEELDSYPKEKLNLQIEGTITKKSLIGVYFFILEDESTINESTWSEFKSGKKISNFNKHGKDCQKILYIGQRNSSVVSRLVNHTVKKSESTQSLALYSPECPNFNYSITLYYQRMVEAPNTTSKIYCLLLETIAKELFPTIIGQ
ncbi:hypothetical protein ACE5JW_04945 [Acinetobacter radioresistens]|jgi:hypothetical protein|uniref:GIY-YIG domain-containing protein n=2 Tax=Bacteria TaxID=2 RepID=A0ABP2GNR4_ACIRA|nr:MULTISPECIES: hypothetical protein [Acinetobacter]EET83357.1 hypothetical protein ACIRA0001_1067 [Acinetobacter radioresistens SK82]EEY88032.1 hypothetical protein HMPREF0018_00779 [Acinetobacter radioresistens SH164]ENV86871.1 hypothetical protein F940_00829 [Acinetobacter radioresistens NIPH 2130]EXB87127.1 hypothetical protein J538_0868 [Acinetobacter sp. 272263]EXE57710.1 hypothetical protein J579_1657 [Acinetobacter sp. 1239920]